MTITNGLNTHRKPGWDFACDSYGKVRHSRKACVFTVTRGPCGGEQIIKVASQIENWDDARLIATAPVLATAARAMVNAFGGDVPDYLKAEFAALETAVIAAEGGAS